MFGSAFTLTYALPTAGGLIGFSADIMAQQVIDPQGPHQVRPAIVKRWKSPQLILPLCIVCRAVEQDGATDIL